MTLLRQTLAALLAAFVPVAVHAASGVTAPIHLPTITVPVGAASAVNASALRGQTASFSATNAVSAAAFRSAPAAFVETRAPIAVTAAAVPTITPALPTTIPAALPQNLAAASLPIDPKKGMLPGAPRLSDDGTKGPASRHDDETARFVFGAKLFDGVGELKTRSGSVFAPDGAPTPGHLGGAKFVRVRPAPAVAPKAVPGTEGLYGADLLARVGQIASQGHHGHDYHEASRYLFSVADNHTLNGVKGVADAYSGVFVPGTSDAGQDYSETGDQDGDGYSKRQGMNVEHVFPQSLFGQRLPMRSDLHHLMATFEHPNGMRGNMRFGVVTGRPDYSNKAGAKRGVDRFEPPDFSKGRVARAMLYFFARYHGEGFFDQRVASFWNPQIEILLAWNKQFPPTVEEQRRNDQVQQFQGNRNPFVDDPTLADRIGADAFRMGRPVARTPTDAVRPVVTQDDQPKRRSDKKREGKKRNGDHRPKNSGRSGRGNRR